MLYKVIELADLFVDACLRNESGELMFLSVYGRDTAVQQFKATMQLKPSSGGISSFTPVSYTHLDVYKRQVPYLTIGSPGCLSNWSG